MPLPRFQRLPAEKRARLLEVAASEFAGKGYEAASLNEILAAAGLGKSSYYYYFADKEDLYATVLEDAFARLLGEVPSLSVAALDAAGFWAAIEAWFSAWIAAVERYPASLTLFRSVQALRHTPGPRFQPLLEKARTLYRVIIETGRALGCVRTDLDIDWLISILEALDVALDEPIWARGRGLSAAEMKAHAALVLDTWRRLLEPPR